MLSRILSVLFFLLCLSPAFADPDVTEVVATQRPAEELLPVLRPLAGNDVSVQAYQGQLVLHGPADRVAVLKVVLAQLDRPLRNLRISVRRHDDARESLAGVGVHASGSVELRQETRTQSTGDTQSLVLVEGAVARLSLDTEIPVLGVAPSGALTTGFVALGNGLDLAPTLSGDRVRLEIRRRDARVDGAGIAAQTVQSVLLLVPGEWSALGALDSGRQGGGDAVRAGHRDAQVTRDSGRDADSARWDVRVDVEP